MSSHIVTAFSQVEHSGRDHTLRYSADNPRHSNSPDYQITWRSQTITCCGRVIARYDSEFGVPVEHVLTYLRGHPVVRVFQCPECFSSHSPQVRVEQLAVVMDANPRIAGLAVSDADADVRKVS